MDIKDYRKQALKDLTNQVGVYALCDLNKIPLYIGQSTDGIRRRVNRHITSARSDVIANRQLDIWEVYEIWAWPLGEKGEVESALINNLEDYLINEYDQQSALVNGKLPTTSSTPENIPNKEIVQIMSEEERDMRLNPIQRLPRQLNHLTSLFTHILEVKNNQEQRRMLRVHFKRMEKYYADFMRDSGETEI